VCPQGRRHAPAPSSRDAPRARRCRHQVAMTMPLAKIASSSPVPLARIHRRRRPRNPCLFLPQPPYTVPPPTPTRTFSTMMPRPCPHAPPSPRDYSLRKTASRLPPCAPHTRAASRHGAGTLVCDTIPMARRRRPPSHNNITHFCA
jgi:hypothetical protein